ncbi:hypothetical protein PENSPDRAFT_650860 [Peniophora sp. CONT]|nr:hypothetical protein PENSPDRAFT_650860 [Peniophora sp. CONT]
MYINGVPAAYVYNTVGPVLATAPGLLILRNEHSWSRPQYWGKSLAIGALVWAGVNLGHYGGHVVGAELR